MTGDSRILLRSWLPGHNRTAWPDPARKVCGTGPVRCDGGSTPPREEQPSQSNPRRHERDRPAEPAPVLHGIIGGVSLGKHVIGIPCQPIARRDQFIFSRVTRTSGGGHRAGEAPEALQILLLTPALHPRAPPPRGDASSARVRTSFPSGRRVIGDVPSPRARARRP